jgi:hypothetical protein
VCKLEKALYGLK